MALGRLKFLIGGIIGLVFVLLTTSFLSDYFTGNQLNFIIIAAVFLVIGILIKLRQEL